MCLKKIGYEGRAEWLQIRGQYIGGSDAAAVLGLDPYRSALALWAEKTGAVKSFDGNVITETGAYLEAFVAGLFTRETGKKVQRCNFVIVNEKYPWACADVDRLVCGESAVLEIKTTNSFINVKKFRTGEFPERWYCQCMHYLAVTGRQKCYLAVLSNCRDFYVFELERDEEEIASLMDAEREFMQRVKDGNPPAPDGSDSASETVAALGGAVTMPETIELPQMAAKLDMRANLKDTIDKLKEQMNEIDNEIKLLMGENENAVAGRWKASWKTQTRSTFDADKFRKNYPQISLDGFYRQSTTRVFKLSEGRRA